MPSYRLQWQGPAFPFQICTLCHVYRKRVLTKTKAAQHTAVVKRKKRAISQAVFLSDVTRSVPWMKSSSKTNGIATARAKGQPTIAPVAKSTVADSVLLEFWADGGARVNAKASVFAYSANDEGKNARKGLAKQFTCHGGIITNRLWHSTFPHWREPWTRSIDLHGN